MKLQIAGEPIPEGLIRGRLARYGVDARRWSENLRWLNMTNKEFALDRFASEIEAEKARGGYNVVDVAEVKENASGASQFSRTHWHDEDEVRMIVNGAGMFGFRTTSLPPAELEVGAGDLIRIPAGLWHWFSLHNEPRLLAIRLFEKAEGWVPHFIDQP
jgi:1,2-dihydroxy-3-keto-5-methylthiopentene dioxygenase